MTTINVKLKGTEQAVSPIFSTLENDDFNIAKEYDLDSIRGSVEENNVPIQSGQMVELIMEDDVEWIGYIDDIADLHRNDISVKRGGSVVYELPNVLRPHSQERGFIKNIRNKIFRIFRNEKIHKTIVEVADEIDRRIMSSPGLYRVERNGQQGEKVESLNEGKALILIHGFISRFSRTFRDMDVAQWQEIYDRYDGGVYAFDHHTIGESPVKNALDLLKVIPERSEIDILSASRGGLVADIIARCDIENPIKGFSEDEISSIYKGAEFYGEDTHIDAGLHEKFDSELQQEMKDISKLALMKRITVNKVIRVACPASGTLLLDERLDHYLNIVMNGLKIAFGVANPLYEICKKFLLYIVSLRADSIAFPGVWCMVPDSSFQKINNGDFELKSELYCIEGDSEIGRNLWHTLKVILTNLYYREANDFVVHTDAMSKGLRKRDAVYGHIISNSNINHFRYFNQKENFQYILNAFRGELAEFDDLLSPSADRGIVIDGIKDFGQLFPSEIIGDKPIIVLIPGIMGSHIYNGDDRIWIKMDKLITGRVPINFDIKLKLEAKAVVGKYYSEFYKYYVSRGYEVCIFPYDWRLSLEELAHRLDKKMSELLAHKVDVNIVSHSMGGLVTRYWRSYHEATWKQFKSQSGGKWIMLGTPWRGSHLMTEVLTGNGSRIKQLSRLDILHNSGELLEVFNKFPGIMQLLPVDDDRLAEINSWNEFLKLMGRHRMAPLPKESLDIYLDYKKWEKNDVLDEDEWNNIYYIAGYDDKTALTFIEKKNFFKGTYLKFRSTNQGDGSVVWETGIPDPLKNKEGNLYYTDVTHGELANDMDIMIGIQDILNQGETSRLSRKKIRGLVEKVRSGKSITPEEIYGPRIDFYQNENALDVILGAGSTKKEVIDFSVKVEVFNGDLKWAIAPVMVGHFNRDGIVSAEGALDYYLDGKLRERHSMGFYPGKIGEQAIIYDYDSCPKGAIVVGLGQKEELTGYLLADSVEKAVLRYAVFFKDNQLKRQEVKNRISTLLVGSSYGGLSMGESIRSILLGVRNANRIIDEMNENRSSSQNKYLAKIEIVEFIDFYEDKAYSCFKKLKEIEQEKNGITIDVKPEIIPGFGKRKRFLRDESQSWWQNFRTSVQVEYDWEGKEVRKYLNFNASNRLASVASEDVYTDLKLALYLAENLSTKSDWSKEDSKAIFELLIPNQFKGFVRNHRNIEWRMDETAAQFPWEMFHDSNFGELPTFVETGIIRQLISRDSEIRPALVNSKTALIIGDPEYNNKDLPQLDEAKKEAELVEAILGKNGYFVESLIRSNPLKIIQSLYSKEYKIIHIASHGIYEQFYDERGKPLKDKLRVGIAIGDDQFLTPGTIKQLSYVPEMVFINCCYSGKIDEADEKYYKNRHRLAANVGMQLIEMGVKAVVVAGWAVNDDAAKTFADQLYTHLLNGEYFGDAIRKARYYTYEQYNNNNTWGAYQCYGDQFYRIHYGKKSKDNFDHLMLEDEIVLEMSNLSSLSNSLQLSKNGESSISQMKRSLELLIEHAKSIHQYTDAVIDMVANLYYIFGDYKNAISNYKSLFENEVADFSIKNYDRYANIYAKHHANNFIQAVTHNEATDGLAEEVKMITDEYENYLLSNFSEKENVFRLSIIGSNKKRIAIVTEGLERIKALEESYEHYHEAAVVNGVDNRGTIYHVTNVFTLYLLGKHLAAIAENKRFVTPRVYEELHIKDYLHSWIKKVENEEPDRTLHWEHLGELQLLLCDMIYDPKKLDVKAERIIRKYDALLTKSISIKDLHGELEHLSFLAFITREIPKLADYREQIIRIRSFISQFR